MPTGQRTSSFSVGGIAFSSVESRSAEGQASHEVTIPAGIAGTMNGTTGVDAIASSHGLTASQIIDLHWLDPGDGSHKCRRGYTIDTANANDIVFDEIPLPAGDALPADGTAVVVSVQVVINTDWDGDDVEIIAMMSNQVGNVEFRDVSAVLTSVKLIASEAWSWISNQGVANPLTGNPVDQLRVSNGSTTAAAFKLGLTYQSVV